MKKIHEFTDLKAIAIVLIFFAHSSLQYTNHSLAVAIQRWAISAFFFVSGYLTYSSFCRKKQDVPKFLAHRFPSIYLPFVFIMGFTLLTDKFVPYHLTGFLSHASLLSVFEVFATGQFTMYQFWFVPHLLVYTILFILLHRYIKNDLARSLTLVAFYTFIFFNFVYLTPIRFEWSFCLYILVFAIGCEISKRARIQRLYTLKSSILLIVAASIAGYVNSTFAPTWDTGTELGRAYFNSYTWLGTTVFSVSSIILLLNFLSVLRRGFPKSRIYTITAFLGSYTLYIYLWEGYFSPIVGRGIFGVVWFYDIAGPLLPPSIFIRLLVASLVAYATQKIYNRIANKFKASKKSAPKKNRTSKSFTK